MSRVKENQLKNELVNAVTNSYSHIQNAVDICMYANYGDAYDPRQLLEECLLHLHWASKFIEDAVPDLAERMSKP